MIIRVLAAVFVGLSFGGESSIDQQSAPAESNTVEPASHLLGVRFFASEQNLDRIEQLAIRAGWTQSRRDVPGSILVLAPQPYRFEMFEALMERILPLRLPDAIQLIGPDGRPVDEDGMPVNETR